MYEFQMATVLASAGLASMARYTVSFAGHQYQTTHLVSFFFNSVLTSILWTPRK
jgi:hypothetical protein